MVELCRIGAPGHLSDQLEKAPSLGVGASLYLATRLVMSEAVYATTLTIVKCPTETFRGHATCKILHLMFQYPIYSGALVGSQKKRTFARIA